jgi:hypothetical protein
MMKQQADDIFDWHFEALRQENEDQVQLIENAEELPPDMASLFGLVHLLWNLLPLLQPRPAFRAALRDQLTAETQRRRTQRALGYGEPRLMPRPRWVVPMAALGTASLVGAYAYWRLSRHSAVDNDALAA